MAQRWIWIVLIFVTGGIVIVTASSHRRIYVTREGDRDWYWNERVPTTRHGICAHLYHARDHTWVVEKPWGSDPATHMSMSSETQIFASDVEARQWIEARCR